MNDIPELMDKIERLETRVAELEAELDWYAAAEYTAVLLIENEYGVEFT